MSDLPGARRPSPHQPGPSVVHRLPAHAKIAAHVAFVLAVVATPATWFWAFAVHAVALLVAITIARLPLPVVLRRMTVEVPFVLFAVALPFVAEGERVQVLALSLSEPGLLAGWNIVAKATLGVVASVLLAATTSTPELLAGLRRLRLPTVLVAIAAFMVRYLDVVRDDLRRMRLAQESRGLGAGRRARWLAAARVAGALFVRTYERGERVHLATLSRGGGVPTALRRRPAQEAHPLLAALLPGAAALTLVSGWVLA